jgi:hypothetical protein
MLLQMLNYLPKIHSVHVIILFKNHFKWQFIQEVFPHFPSRFYFFLSELSKFLCSRGDGELVLA